MESGKSLSIWIGYDSREAVCSDVCAHSIKKRTSANLDIKYLKHRDLRQSGKFARPWLVDAPSGNLIDMIDGKQFSTEFSHTRFLVPALMHYQGWALFMDADMICLSDINKLFAMADEKYAVMCVKHNHKVSGESTKMDGRQQLSYFRKNWSSFVLWNCGHQANRQMTEDRVNFMKGSDLHAFSWLTDDLIGSIPFTYNFISGISPKLPTNSAGFPAGKPDVIHYTEGGPWFEECQDVPYGGLWTDEYEDYQANGIGGKVSSVPSIAFETPEVIRK